MSIKSPLGLPKLRFKGFEGEWEEKKLKDISSKCRSGGTPKADNKLYYDGNIPFLSISNIKSKYLFKTTKHINELAVKNSSSYILPSNNLLLTIYATIGVPCINKIDLALPQSILGIILKEYFNLEFTYYLFIKSINKFKKIIEKGSQPNLSLGNILKIDFAFPSLLEQEKIAQFFSLLDKQIELWEKKLQLVELIKNKMISAIFAHNTFTPKWRFKGFSRGWDDKKIKDSFYVINGLSGLNKSNFIQGKDSYLEYIEIYKFQKLYDVNGRYFDLKDSKQNPIQKNDILITSTSETPLEIGISSIYLGASIKYLNSFCFAIRSKLESINAEYVNIFLCNKNYRKEIIRICNGSTRYNISKNEFKELSIKFPSLQEQTKIAYFFNIYDKLLGKINNIISVKKQMKIHYLTAIFL